MFQQVRLILLSQQVLMGVTYLYIAVWYFYRYLIFVWAAYTWVLFCPEIPVMLEIL
jgi:hypothetical protein